MTLHFHRFVLFLEHEINGWIKFTSELEVEHAFIEGGEERERSSWNKPTWIFPFTKSLT